jgi:hypothetical protein
LVEEGLTTKDTKATKKTIATDFTDAHRSVPINSSVVIRVIGGKKSLLRDLRALRG